MAHRTPWAVAQDGGVPLVDPEVGAGFLEGVGQPGVVGVAMGQEYGTDVGHRAAEADQQRAQLHQMGGCSRVDQDETVRVLDQVEVDAVIAEAVDARCHLRGRGTGHVSLRQPGNIQYSRL